MAPTSSSKAGFAERAALAAATAGFLIVGAAAEAGVINPSDPIITVTATSGALSGTVTVPLAAATVGPNGWMYFTAVPQDIIDPGTFAVIGRINSMSTLILDENRIGLNFNVTAGQSDTNFSITSTLLSFAPFPTPSGAASASVTLTDADGNGAVLGAISASGRFYNSSYNGSNTFADLVLGPISAGAFGSNSSSQNEPVVPGFVPILTPVSDMSSGFAFSLTANDRASGTSTFVIIPAPGVMIVLGGAALASLGRRRR